MKWEAVRVPCANVGTALADLHNNSSPGEYERNATYGVSFSVIHAKAACASTEAVALGSKVLSVAGVAKHFAVVLADTAGVE